MKKFDPIRVLSFEEFKKDFMNAYKGEFYARRIDGVPMAEGFVIDPTPWEDAPDFGYDPTLTVEDVKKDYCEASPEIIRERYEEYLEWCRWDYDEEHGEVGYWFDAPIDFDEEDDEND